MTAKIIPSRIRILQNPDHKALQTNFGDELCRLFQPLNPFAFWRLIDNRFSFNAGIFIVVQILVGFDTCQFL